MPWQTSPLVLAPLAESSWTINGPAAITGVPVMNVKPTSLGDPSAVGFLEVLSTGVLYSQASAYDYYIKIKNRSTSSAVQFVIVGEEV